MENIPVENSQTTTPLTIGIEEAAQYLNLPISRIRYEVFKERIPFIKVGASVLFLKRIYIAGLKVIKRG